jgi:hypothetical protein
LAQAQHLLRLGKVVVVLLQYFHLLQRQEVEAAAAIMVMFGLQVNLVHQAVEVLKRSNLQVQ